jgi:choline kinase
MPDWSWIILSFCAGSFAMMNSKTIYHKDIFEENAKVTEENRKLKLLVSDLTDNIENNARKITIGVLERVVKDLQKHGEK